MSFLALWIGVGALGGLASMARFLLDGLIISTSALGGFPLGTLAVNLSGTVVLGFLVGVGLHGDAYLLGATAVIGSYTTFSTWLLESHRLAEDGRRWLLGANLLLSLVLGIAAAELGRSIGGG
jgi:fluoride exporter